MRNVSLSKVLSRLVSKNLSKSIHFFTIFVYLCTFLGPSLAVATSTQIYAETSNIPEEDRTFSTFKILTSFVGDCLKNVGDSSQVRYLYSLKYSTIFSGAGEDNPLFDPETITPVNESIDIIGNLITNPYLEIPHNGQRIPLSPVAKESLTSFQHFLNHLDEHDDIKVTTLEGDTIESLAIFRLADTLGFYYLTPRGFWPFAQVEKKNQGPQRVKHLFKKVNGEFSSFIDFEIDFEAKTFLFFNYKGPKVEFGIDEYAVKFGNLSTNQFANIICTGSEINLLCDSFKGDYFGIYSPNLNISVGKTFSFGSGHETQESVSITIGNRSIPQSFTYYVNSGCYAQVSEKFVVGAPSIHFDFGDIACGTLVTVPPTYFEVSTSATWFESNHRDFGIQDLSVRAAHIHVNGAWYLLAKDCKIQADLNRFNFYYDEGYERFGHEVQLPNSRHPLVSHGEVYYAYAAMQVSDQNNMGCYGFATRQSHPKAQHALARYPFSKLIETDPLLETYYPLPSFLGTYSDKGEKDLQYQQMVIYTPVNEPYEIRLPGYGNDAPSSVGRDDPYGFSRTLLRGYFGSTSQRMNSLRLDQRINQQVQMTMRSDQERLSRFHEKLAQRHERVVQYDNKNLDFIVNSNNDTIEYNASEERRGRSEEHQGLFSRARSTSPPRIEDTYYENSTNWFTEKVKKCYEAKENLSIVNFGPKVALPALGAVSVDVIIRLNDGLDFITYDYWSYVNKFMDDVAHDAQTYVRRGTRFVSGNQRYSQNLGDGVYVALSLFGNKGLKSIKVVKEAADAVKNLSRVKKINNRMPRNHEWAGKLFPLEKISLTLQQKYPHGVHFTGMGYPDFTRYAKAKVNIKVTGDHYIDKKLANAKAGFNKTPEGYTWHHHHNGTTMELIPYDLHRAIKHTGGVAKTKGLK